ncbi:hypothetical protein YB2330_002073 [Saitoella coloradoensis]
MSQPVQINGPPMTNTPPRRAPNRNLPKPKGNLNQGAKRSHKNHRRPLNVETHTGLSHHDDDFEAEFAETAFFGTPDRRGRVNLNHLLNFQMAPRPAPVAFTSPRPRTKARSYGIGSGHHPEDKARFVNANYRFIVDPRGDYRTQTLDPDMPLQWDDILQVLASEQTQSNPCPICLTDVPVAPRISKCGHVFCLPCVIQYLQSEELGAGGKSSSKWRKCPMCHDSVYPSELRPVKWYAGEDVTTPREGGDIVLRLMERQPGSSLAMPVDAVDFVASPDEIPYYYSGEARDYARIMRGTEDYMLDELDREVAELRTMEAVDQAQFGEDSGWARQAVDKIAQDKEGVKGIGKGPEPERVTKKKGKRAEVQFGLGVEGAPEAYLARNEIPVSGSTTPAVDEVQSLKPPPPSRAVSTQHDANTPYYFYQPRSNSRIYLSSLDIRILKRFFGDYASFPPSILVRIDHISNGHTVDDDIRRRTKYLGHLPRGCEVSFIECDWSDVVSEEVLREFKVDIDKRTKKRKDKEAKEERDRVRAERMFEEMEYPGAALRRQQSEEHPFRDDDFAPLGSSYVPVPSTSPPLGTSLGTSFSSTGSGSGSHGTSSSPSKTTVWGTQAVPGTYSHATKTSDNAGWAQDWEDQLLAQAIAESEATAATATANGDVLGSVSNAGAGKKGKKKKIVLMSTGAFRG